MSLNEKIHLNDAIKHESTEINDGSRIFKTEVTSKMGLPRGPLIYISSNWASMGTPLDTPMQKNIKKDKRTKQRYHFDKISYGSSC